MACMCGDTCCPSCGPAQGNVRCFCGQWWGDCDHLDDDGNVKPEYQAEADEADRRQRADDEQLVKDLAEADRLAEEYWRSVERDPISTENEC